MTLTGDSTGRFRDRSQRRPSCRSTRAAESSNGRSSTVEQRSPKPRAEGSNPSVRARAHGLQWGARGAENCTVDEKNRQSTGVSACRCLGRQDRPSGTLASACKRPRAMDIKCGLSGWRLGSQEQWLETELAPKSGRSAQAEGVQVVQRGLPRIPNNLRDNFELRGLLQGRATVPKIHRKRRSSERRDNHGAEFRSV